MLNMPRNRILECPTCFKQVRSDLLKSHCKSKHGMSDHEIKLLKTYSCKYCKKNFSRRVNCGYHELHLENQVILLTDMIFNLELEMRKMEILRKSIKVSAMFLSSTERS